MEKALSWILTAVLLLSLAACGGAAEQETASAPTQTTATAVTEAAVEAVSYTFTFSGMMGEETAQFDLYSDGTCRFYLPGNPMITDVYVAPYLREGDTVTVTGLTNVDASSAYATPGLWDWIVEGNCTITVEDADGTFIPAGAAPVQGENQSEGLKNVAYASVSPSQVCDIYLPEETEKRRSSCWSMVAAFSSVTRG